MNKLLLSASLIAIAIPGTAYAGETYVGLSGGVVIPSDSHNEGTTTAVTPATASFPAIASGTDFSFDTEMDMGWTAGGQVGYAFDNGFRLEVEGTYAAYDVGGHSNFVLGTTNIGSSDSAILTRGTASSSNPTVNSFLNNGSGDVETYGGFLNALYDFDLGGVKPYLGVGVGLLWTDIDFTGSTGLGIASDSQMELAGQGIAGVSAELSDNVELFAEYKYRRLLEDNSLDLQLIPASMSVEAEQHLATAGLRFRFGGDPVVVAPPPPPPPVVRPVAPPPPPPPPPAPRPVARQCNTGPYIVFFDWDKSDITAEAASVLNSAVTAYGDCGTAAIMLAGHADRSGSTQYNVGLSERRNASVTSYLAGRGIPAARIGAQAFGEGQNRVATADGVRELQNRRVEISYGPGSGR